MAQKYKEGPQTQNALGRTDSTASTVNMSAEHRKDSLMLYDDENVPSYKNSMVNMIIP